MGAEVWSSACLVPKYSLEDILQPPARFPLLCSQGSSRTVILLAMLCLWTSQILPCLLSGEGMLAVG